MTDDAPFEAPVSLPRIVREDFERTATVRHHAFLYFPYSRDPIDDEEKRRRSRLQAAASRLQETRFSSWLRHAKTAVHAGLMTARAMPPKGSSRNVHAIGLLLRGRLVLTVPSVAGWPTNGPVDETGRDLDRETALRILERLSDVDRHRSKQPKNDMATAGHMLGAVLRTMHPQTAEAFSQEDGGIWMVAGFEQEDGLLTCVLDPSDCQGAEESHAWHPPASITRSVPLRLLCTRNAKGWLIESEARSNDAILSKPLDAIETLRLSSPHLHEEPA